MRKLLCWVRIAVVLLKCPAQNDKQNIPRKSKKFGTRTIKNNNYLPVPRDKKKKG